MQGEGEYRKRVTSTSLGCHPQKASNSTIWGGTNRSSLRNAAWRSVARRVVPVSTLRNYAQCHVAQRSRVTLLPPGDRGSNPATAFRKSIHRMCEHRPPLHILEGGTRNVGILEIPPQTPQKCDLYGISGDQTTNHCRFEHRPPRRIPGTGGANATTGRHGQSWGRKEITPHQDAL